jgi:hypothetical protein
MVFNVLYLMTEEAQSGKTVSRRIETLLFLHVMIPAPGLAENGHV